MRKGLKAEERATSVPEGLEDRVELTVVTGGRKYHIELVRDPDYTGIQPTIYGAIGVASARAVAMIVDHDVEGIG